MTETTTIETAEKLQAELAGLPGSQRITMLTELTREYAADILGHDSAADVAPDAAFFEIGFTSLMAVDLRNRLSEATGIDLPAMLLFDQPTPEMVAEFAAPLI